MKTDIIGRATRIAFVFCLSLLLGACGGGGGSAAATAIGSSAPVPVTAGSFTMSLSPSTLTIAAGAGIPSSLTITPSGGFSGSVTLALTSAPDGVTVAPSTVSVSGVTTTQVTVTPSASVIPGTYSFNLQGTSSSISATASLTLSVEQAHPRLILDTATLTTLRARAAANTPQWQALKAACDSLIGGTVNYPTQNAYPNLPNLGSGYQGESYLPALLNESMCYQILVGTNPTAAAPYGAKAVDILMKMSTPYSTGSGNLGENPLVDDGYAIRFYGVGFGLGYDWLYNLLTPAQRQQVYTTANAWLSAFEDPNGAANFEYANPQSNYYAGYFHAKAVIALATDGDNPDASTEWNDWLNNQFYARVQPYYQKHLLGGGWPEGFANYAPLGILNMSLPMREVMTAKGINLITGSAPYSYPLDIANYVMQFTWPSLNYFDDRDTNHANSNTQPPGTPSVGMFQQIAGELVYWKSPLAPVFNQYLQDVTTATSNFSPADPWLAFLEIDPNAPTAPLSTQPLSYLAPGMGAVAARSDWTTGATWMSFRAGPYVNNPAQGEEYFDQGSLALVRGGTPLLVNAGGWLVHNPNGTADENEIYNDNYGSFNGTVYQGNRQLYNIFYVRNMSGGTVLNQFGQGAYTTESNNVRTQVTGFEDGGSYVYVLATHLEDMYRSFSGSPAVAAWAREIVYLRPNRFVVYDRTTEGSSSYDQYMAWAFPASPTAATAPSGENVLDVNYNGQFAGAMTTVLPANATLTTLPLYPGDNPVKVYQVQVRPPNSNVSQQWLTVFDLSSSASTVAGASPVTNAQGGITGVVLADNGSGNGNDVVIFSTGTPGTPIAGTISYTVPTSAAEHVITELQPSTSYSVTAAASGGTLTITVAPGSGYTTSAQGVLHFNVSAAGAVSG
ncbi:MAG: hypothetical protein KGL63_01385 [Betaproteobacteria bacterium]|nr:hypothetical protein [Betaproteobacteria bacterium]